MVPVGKVKRLMATAVLLSSTGWSQAQVVVSDDFTDGDFTLNPSWMGQTTHFAVNAQQLRLQAPPQAGSSALFTPSTIAVQALWEVQLNLDYNPSSSNYAEFLFQITDTNALTGYGIRVGGSTPDRISLLRYDQGTAVVLQESTDGWANRQPLTAFLRIQRRDDTLTVAADTAVGTAPAALFHFRDSTYRSSAFIGVRMTYTATRNQAFGADNLLAHGYPYQDTTAPVVVSFHNPGVRQLHLLLSEPVDTLAGLWSAELEGLGTAVRLQGGQQEWTLTWPEPPPPGRWLNLSLFGLADTAGNGLNINLPVVWNLASTGMAFLSEIMADPEPVVGLPPVEYVEVAWDTAVHNMPLNGWRLIINQTSYPLHGYAHGGTYQLFTADTAAYPGAHPLPWSPTALLNSGATLQLVDPLGQCASEVAYTSDWYADDLRSAGGWSLEARTSESFPDASTWGASKSPTGGTPGAKNSALQTEPPPAVRAYPLAMLFGDTAVGIAFNRPVWDSVLFHPEGWTLSGNHRTARIRRASPHQWVLRLAQPVGSEPLEIRPPHPYDQITLQVGLPQPPQPGQALLNEVLFEPRSSGAEFVELYRTDGFTDLSQLHLVELDADVKTLLKTYRITEEPYLLPPRTHVALTPDTLAVRKGHASGLLFETHAWPGLSNDGGALGVATTRLILLEGMAFDPDMHFELLENTAGYSLERLSSSLVASDKATWHSGAQLVGGATPGLANSQQVAAVHSQPAFTVSPHPITPNGDGMDDVLTVAYRFSQPGYAITIRIFDLSGQLIQTVANNALAETEGLAVWNATQDNGGLARTGPYVVWMQAIHPGGDQILQRASAAVSH